MAARPKGSHDNGTRYVTWKNLWVVSAGILSLVFAVGLVVQELHGKHPHDGAVTETVFAAEKEATKARHAEILRQLQRIWTKLDK